MDNFPEQTRVQCYNHGRTGRTCRLMTSCLSPLLQQKLFDRRQTVPEFETWFTTLSHYTVSDFYFEKQRGFDPRSSHTKD